MNKRDLSIGGKRPILARAITSVTILPPLLKEKRNFEQFKGN
jgi:hypothetical protein